MCKSKSRLKKNLEQFLENLEKDQINLKNIKKFRHNIAEKEQMALKEIKNWNKQTFRIQDKGSKFVILDNSDYQEKVQPQINRTSFQKLSQNSNKIYKKS